MEEKCDEVKGIVALCLGYLDLLRGPSIAGGPLHRSDDEVATEGVDFCTLFWQIANCRHLDVNSCLMKRCDILLIAVRRSCASRVYEFSISLMSPR